MTSPLSSSPLWRETIIAAQIRNSSVAEDIFKLLEAEKEQGPIEKDDSKLWTQTLTLKTGLQNIWTITRNRKLEECETPEGFRFANESYTYEVSCNDQQEFAGNSVEITQYLKRTFYDKTFEVISSTN